MTKSYVNFSLSILKLFLSFKDKNKIILNNYIDTLIWFMWNLYDIFAILSYKFVFLE